MAGVRSTATSTRKVPGNGYYPKFLQGASGSVWLVTAPKQGVIVHLADRPQKAKHKVGYATSQLNESKMDPYTGQITLNVTAAY